MVQKQLEPNSPNSLVANENSGQKVLKISEMHIEGVTKNSATPLKGLIARIKMLCRQILDFRHMSSG